jgi:hypothetical protein
MLNFEDTLNGMRDLNAATWVSSSMTPQLCATFCLTTMPILILMYIHL